MPLTDGEPVGQLALKTSETFAAIVDAGKHGETIELCLYKRAAERGGQPCTQHGLAHQAAGNNGDIKTVADDAVPRAGGGALSPRCGKFRCLRTPAGACYAEATQKSGVRHQRILNGFRPRGRGRDEGGLTDGEPMIGPPARARKRRVRPEPPIFPHGSTRARAEETSLAMRRNAFTSVHPRARGRDATDTVYLYREYGPPARARKRR